MRLIKQNPSLSQRGDTIVEVLISVAVASMVLASAYAITNRNVRTTQDTQEHSQAQQIAQQQIERLRALSGSNGLGAFQNDDCITQEATLAPALINGPACQFDSSGTSSPAGCASACYTVTIGRGVAAPYVYEVIVKWENILGKTSQLSMEYGI